MANALLLGGRALSVKSVSVHMNWRVMIKIRYVDPNKISPGLHAAVECHGRTTTVYLLCGLRPQQRRAAFRRLRMSARTGYCPALPAPQLALARLADRIRTGLGQAGAVFRSHPAASAVPVMLVSAGAMAFLLLPAASPAPAPDPARRVSWPRRPAGGGCGAGAQGPPSGTPPRYPEARPSRPAPPRRRASAGRAPAARRADPRGPRGSRQRAPRPAAGRHRGRGLHLPVLAAQGGSRGRCPGPATASDRHQRHRVRRRPGSAPPPEALGSDRPGSPTRP